jgi:hypothetical protein
MAEELAVARQADLAAHIKEDWKTVHAPSWENIKAYIDAEGYVPLTATNITTSFTWDDAQRTLDLTAATCATARLAIMSFVMTRDGDWRTPFKFRTVGGAVDIIQIGGDYSNIDTADGSSKGYWAGGGGYIIPIDANQQIDYIAPSGCTTKAVYLLGYFKKRG